MTSFAKKELGVVFLCVSLGVLALSYPFFVSATTGTQIFCDIALDGQLSNCDPVSCEYGKTPLDRVEKNATGHTPNTGEMKGGGGLSCGEDNFIPPEQINIDMDSYATGDGLYDRWFYSEQTENYPNDPNYYFTATRASGTWSTPSPPICELGNCALCEVWTTCQTAGCSWGCAPDWSGMGCWCEEPVSQPEECGGFYKCQYCETEEDCVNADVTCEWATRGQITKCFTKRPVVPEAQEEWQTCEFDNCTPDPPLGLVEKWVCLLKNALQGIYCPSQETLTDLQHTLETFEEKFPFNYIVAIKEFLNDIKTSLATPKAITISMFGASGTMNFDFLDMPVTIGGVEETMGNIFTDITSILIYIAFFFWLLAFIRRFF
jgi:hypothetical protein